MPMEETDTGKKKGAVEGRRLCLQKVEGFTRCTRGGDALFPPPGTEQALYAPPSLQDHTHSCKQWAE